MGVSSAGSQNTWFIVVMAILVAAMIVVFLTRRWQPKWVWVRHTIPVLRSPIAWGAAVGIVVGIRGIPVVIPGTGAEWVWVMPSGAYVASVTGFGSVGCLVGAVTQFWSRKVVNWKIGIWAFGIPAFALVIGMFGLYRIHAHVQLSTQYLASMGLASIPSTATILANPNSSHAAVDRAAGWLIRGGADLGAAGQYATIYASRANYEEVGNGLSNAGYTILLSNNRTQVKRAEQYVINANAIFQRAVQASPKHPFTDIPGLVNHIASITPQSLQFGGAI